MDESSAPPDPLKDDAQFILDLRNMPRAKLLVEHMSAFDALTLSGGIRGVEPPAAPLAGRRTVTIEGLTVSRSLGKPIEPRLWRACRFRQG